MSLKRWFREKWTAQDGSECGDYEGKGRVKCRPSKKVNEDTPVTWNELSDSQKRRAVEEKQKATKKGKQFSGLRFSKINEKIKAKKLKDRN